MTNVVGRVLSVCAGAWALALWPSPAAAQQYLIGGAGAVSSGVEGGSQGALYRTRTRLRIGADLRIDESPDDILEFGLQAEVEPRSAFGADLRYARAASEHLILDAGILGFLAPSSFYGVCAGITYRLPLSKRSAITLGPEADFFFLGSDLPDGTVVWQLRFQGGLRVDL